MNKVWIVQIGSPGEWMVSKVASQEGVALDAAQSLVREITARGGEVESYVRPYGAYGWREAGLEDDGVHVEIGSYAVSVPEAA